MLVGCPARAQVAPDTVRIYTAPPRSIGWTFCNDAGRAESWVRADLPPSLMAQVQVHEAKHREQFGRYPSCEEATATIAAHPDTAIRIEAEAFCAAIPAAIAAGAVDSAETRRHLVEMLLRYPKAFQLGVPRLLELSNCEQYR